MTAVSGEDLASKLAADVAAATTWDHVDITALTRLSGGASRETWSFDAGGDGKVLPLILRRDPPGAPRTRPGGMRLDGFGHYHETYVKGADGWRIASSKLTRVHSDFVVPEAG